MAIYRIKRFSLPSDWDEDDDKYVKMVEKAKERNKKIAKVGPYITPTVAAIGGAIGGGKVILKAAKKHDPIGYALFGAKRFKKEAAIGSLIGAVGGVAGAYTGRKISDTYSQSRGIKPKSFKNLSDSDQKEADKALSKYRNMKTKEERKAFRKRIGSRV